MAFGAASVVTGERRNLLRAALPAAAMLRGFNLLDQMTSSKAVIGLNMLRLWDDRGSLERWITPLRAALDAGELRPSSGPSCRSRGRATPTACSSERRNMGKVVLVP